MAKEDRRTGSVFDAAFGSTTVTVGAPTVAEITALTRIELGVVDTIDTPRNGNTADISSLGERETFHVSATIDNAPVTGTFWREFDGTDTYWTLFDDTAVPPTTQYLVVCRGGFTGGDPTAGDDVDVYTVEVVSRSPVGPDKGEGQRFEVTLAVSAVNPSVTVAA